jgi:hypothetical protein
MKTQTLLHTLRLRGLALSRAWPLAGSLHAQGLPTPVDPTAGRTGRQLAAC